MSRWLSQASGTSSPSRGILGGRRLYESSLRSPKVREEHQQVAETLTNLGSILARPGSWMRRESSPAGPDADSRRPRAP